MVEAGDPPCIFQKHKGGLLIRNEIKLHCFVASIQQLEFVLQQKHGVFKLRLNMLVLLLWN
jgi:hypothetical protein